MIKKGISLSLLGILANCSIVGAHPIFLIKDAQSQQGRSDDPKGRNSTKHPTQYLKGLASDDSFTFYLPRSLAQIDLTFVVYASVPPPAVAFMEPAETNKPDNSTDSTDTEKPDQSGKVNSPAKLTADEKVAIWKQNSKVVENGSVPLDALGATKSKSPSVPKPANATDSAKPKAKVSKGKSAKGTPSTQKANGSSDQANAGTSSDSPDKTDNGTALNTPTSVASGVSTRPIPGGVSIDATPITINSLQLHDAVVSTDDYAKERCQFIVTVPESAKIKIVSVPDENLKFRVVLGDLHGLVTDVTKASISTSSTGVIAGVDTDFHDRTADIIADIGVTAADGAAFAAKFSPMAALAPTAPTYRPVFVKAASVKVTKIVDLKATSADGLSTILDISDVKEAIEDCLKRMGYPGGHGEADLSMPTLTLTYSKPLVEMKSADIINSEGFEGIIVRDPQQTRIRLMAANNFLFPCRLAEQLEMIAQTGTVSGIKIQKKALSQNGRTITLNDYGGVTTLTATGTSPIKEFTGGLREIGDSLNGISIPHKGK